MLYIYSIIKHSKTGNCTVNDGIILLGNKQYYN